MCSAAGSRVPWHCTVASEGATGGLPGGISSGLEFPVHPLSPVPSPWWSQAPENCQGPPSLGDPRGLPPRLSTLHQTHSLMLVYLPRAPPTQRLLQTHPVPGSPASSPFILQPPCLTAVPMCPGAQRLREVKGLSPGHTGQSVGQRPLPSKSPCFGGWGWTAQPHQTPACV